MVEEKTNKEIENIPVSIIDEGKQLCVRFPKRLTEALKINPKEDMFLFKFDKKKLHLEGELIDKQEVKND